MQFVEATHPTSFVRNKLNYDGKTTCSLELNVFPPTIITCTKAKFRKMLCLFKQILS